MDNVYIRPMMPGDSWLVLSDLRREEVDEFDAIGVTSDHCIRIGMQLCDPVTVFIHGECAGIVGIIDYGTHRVPWAVFTTVIDRYPLAFLRASRAWLEGEENLENCVDARNTKALKWFCWLGFHVEPAVMVSGLPFHRVVRDLKQQEAA